MVKRTILGIFSVLVFALVLVGFGSPGRQARAQITRPTYTPPTMTAPSYTPPSATRPTYTPPSVTRPSYTPPTPTRPTYTSPSVTLPTYTPPTYTPPTVTLPTYTPPSASGFVPTSSTSGSVPAVGASGLLVFPSGSFFQRGSYNKLARFDRAASHPLAVACRSQGIAVTEERGGEGYFTFEVYSREIPLAIGVTYHSPNGIARVGYFVHSGVPRAWASDFVRWLLVNAWPAEPGLEK